MNVSTYRSHGWGWVGWWYFHLHRMNTWRGRTLAIVCSRRVCGCPHNPDFVPESPVPARLTAADTSLRRRKTSEYRGSSMPYFVKIIIELIKMHKRASHSSGMSKENSPSCKAAVGLAFQKSLGQKGAGGDHLGQPRLNARRAAEHPPRSKFFVLQPKNVFSCSRASRFICIVWVY